MRGRSSKRQQPDTPQRQEEVTLQLIASKLERLVWRRRIWGVDERQVWHVVRRMDEMYRQLYREQEVRYQALLEQANAEFSGSSGAERQHRASSPSSQPTNSLGAAQVSQAAAQTRVVAQPLVPRQQPQRQPATPPYRPPAAAYGRRFRTTPGSRGSVTS